MSSDSFKCSCERCTGHIEAPVQAAGTTVECPHCHQPTRLLRPDETFKCSCEQCGGHIEVPAATEGSSVECPHCHQVTRLLRPDGADNSGVRVAIAPRVQAAPVERSARAAQQRPRPPAKPRGKNWLLTFLFALFLGGFGIDRFYTGRIGLGIGKLLTGGGCGLWSLIDMVLLLTQKYQDAEGNHLRPAKRSHIVIALSILGATILLNIIVMAAAVRGIKSNLESMAEELGAQVEVQIQYDVADKSTGAPGPIGAIDGFKRRAPSRITPQPSHA